MSKETDIIKKTRNKILESIISGSETVAGSDLSKVKMSIWDIKLRTYKACEEVAEELAREELRT